MERSNRLSVFQKSRGVEQARLSLIPRISSVSVGHKRKSLIPTKDFRSRLPNKVSRVTVNDSHTVRQSLAEKVDQFESEDSDSVDLRIHIGAGSNSGHNILQAEIKELEDALQSAKSAISEEKMQVTEYQQRVLELQKQNAKLQVQINQHLRDHKIQQIELDTKKNSLDNKEKRLSLKFDNLSSQDKLKEQREISLREELKACKTQVLEAKQECEEKLKSCRHEFYKTQSYLQQRLEASEQATLELKEKNKNLNIDVESCKTEFGIYKNNQAAFNRSDNIRAIEEENERMKIDIQRTKQYNKELENKLQDVHESAAIVSSLREDIEKLRTLDRTISELSTENALLKKAESNYELLVSKYETCCEELKRKQADCAHLADVELENKILKERVGNWEKSLVSCKINVDDPLALEAKVREVEDERSIVSDLQQELKDRCERNNSMQHQIKTLEVTVNTLGSKCDVLTNQIGRLQKKASLVQMERDHLRHIKETYENEMTSNISVSELGDNRGIIQERLAQLEKEARVRHEYITKLENDVQNLTAAVDNKAKEDQSSIKYRDEIDKLKNEVERLNNLVKDVEIKGFIHSNQKIFEFGESNPCDNMENMINTSELSTRIHPTTSTDNLDLKYQRALEVFEEKTREFRRIIYLTTGYVINLSTDGKQCNITSVYAEREEDKLLFAITPGEVNLIQSDMLESLEYVSGDYLPYRGSIPALLGAIQVELFNRSTRIPIT